MSKKVKPEPQVASRVERKVTPEWMESIREAARVRARKARAARGPFHP